MCEVSVQRLGHCIQYRLNSSFFSLYAQQQQTIKLGEALHRTTWPLEEQQGTTSWLVGVSRDTDMFTAIARLLFGGEEKTADDAQPSGEVVDEGWLLLNHRGYLFLYYYVACSVHSCCQLYERSMSQQAAHPSAVFSFSNINGWY